MEAVKLINSGSNFLKEKKIHSHKLDSEILLSEILNESREELLRDLEKKIHVKNVSLFNKLIVRRSSSEPIAYILNKKEFWSKNFYVDRNTLVPRPETELMVDKLVSIFNHKREIFILDIGTGSGCILLSILNELQKSTGYGLDLSQKALNIAIKNSKEMNLFDRTKFFRRSFENIFNYKFDLIVSNPPYVEKKDFKNLSDDIKKFEPKLALDGGNDGLDVIKKVIYKSRSILKINGILSLEIGNGQYKKVSKILVKNNFKIKHLIKDYRDNIRCVISTFER